MADNILSAKIQVTAPGVQATFDGVAAGASKANKSLSLLERQIASFGGGVRSFTNNFASIKNNFDKIPPAAENLNKAVAKTKINFTDLGRVIQDLPFGFVGIQNNLTQLIPSVGALGLAFSGIIAAVTFAQVGFSAWTRGLGGAKDATDENKESLDDLSESIKEVTDNIEGLTSAISFQNKLGAVNVKILDLGDIEDLRQQSVAQQQLVQDLRSQTLTAQKNYSRAIELNQQEQNEKTQELEQRAFDSLRDAQKSEREALNDGRVIFRQIELQKIEDIKDANKKKKKERGFEFDALKAIFNDLLQIQKEFAFQIKDGVNLRIKIRADLAITPLRANAGSAFDDFSKQLPEVSDKLQKEVDRLTKGNIILKLGTKFTLDMSAAEAQIRKDLEGINSIFKETVADVFGNIGETLGQALSGGDIQKGIQGLFTAIASGIQAIGKQFIKIGTLALLANLSLKKLFSNPALSIAVGIALVAAGAALKNSLSGGISGARALGGPVRKGGTYLVGENGPELFTPDTGGNITSNSNLKSAGISSAGGMAVQVVGQLLLRGNDLVAAIANANRSQGRLT